MQTLYTFDRLGRTETDEVSAGDLCAVVGMEDVDIGDTIADFDNAVALPPITVDEPTLEMVFRINDSPFVGQDGAYVTSRQLRDRLMKELESNVALRVHAGRRSSATSSTSPAAACCTWAFCWKTCGARGLNCPSASPGCNPARWMARVQEPIEYLVVDVPTASVGPVMELVGNRRGECVKMEMHGELAHIEFTIPARGLIGLRTRMLNSTSGAAIMHHNFYDYQPIRGSIPSRLNGVMVAMETGRTTAYALDTLQERGILFVGAGEQVYEGQIVAEHCRDNDLPVNPCREKKLTNMRASGSDKSVILKPPRQLTLELALEYIEDDEYVEITPNAIRLRKMYLSENDRKRFARQA